MRSIDADALMQQILGIIWYRTDDRGMLIKGAENVDTAYYKAEDIYAAIENAPTISLESEDKEYKKYKCQDCKWLKETNGTHRLNKYVCTNPDRYRAHRTKDRAEHNADYKALSNVACKSGFELKI